MRDIEMRGTLGIREDLWRDDRTAVLAARPLAEGAPHPLERAGVRIEDDNTMIAVTVRHEQFIGRCMHPGVRGAVHVDRVSIALALVASADLQHELSVGRELQVCIIGNRLEPGQAGGRTIVSADPHEALMVDIDAMLALGPVISAPRAAPGLHEVASRIEHDDRGRSLSGVFGLERARTVQEPDIVLRVDGEARRISELELRRQLRPRRVNLEHRNAARLRLRRLRSRLVSEKPCGWHASSDEVRQQTNETESPTLHGFLLSHPIRSPRRRAQATYL